MQWREKLQGVKQMFQILGWKRFPLSSGQVHLFLGSHPKLPKVRLKLFSKLVVINLQTKGKVFLKCPFVSSKCPHQRYDFHYTFGWTAQATQLSSQSLVLHGTSCYLCNTLHIQYITIYDIRILTVEQGAYLQIHPAYCNKNSVKRSPFLNEEWPWKELIMTRFYICCSVPVSSDNYSSKWMKQRTIKSDKSARRGRTVSLNDHRTFIQQTALPVRCETRSQWWVLLTY